MGEICAKWHRDASCESLSFKHAELQRLIKSAKPRYSRHDEKEKQHKHITVDDLSRHFEKHGANRTWLTSEEDFTIVRHGRDVIVTDIFIVPKYYLSFGSTHRAQMDICLQMTVTDSHAEKVQFLSPEGGYSLNTHRFLRTQFATVLRLESGEIVDLHSDWIRNCGQTEQWIFVRSRLVEEDPHHFNLGALAVGPDPYSGRSSKDVKSDQLQLQWWRK